MLIEATFNQQAADGLTAISGTVRHVRGSNQGTLALFSGRWLGDGDLIDEIGFALSAGEFSGGSYRVYGLRGAS